MIACTIAANSDWLIGLQKRQPECRRREKTPFRRRREKNNLDMEAEANPGHIPQDNTHLTLALRGASSPQECMGCSEAATNVST